MPNDQLFIDVLVHIERTPERWDQTHWARRTWCGTTFCFAGWAIYLADGPQRDLNSYADSDRAEKLLGIAGHQNLFVNSNTLDDLYRKSAELTGLDETVLREKVQAEL